MKKIIAAFLVVCIFIICGCALISEKDMENGSDIPKMPVVEEKNEENAQASSVTEESKLLESYLEDVQKEIPHVRQVGEPASFVKLDGDLVAYVSYPETGYPVLDNSIVEWINNTVEYCVEDNESFGDNVDGAELSVWYESYKAGENIVSVKLSGSYFSRRMAHPEDILKTYIYDIEKKKILKAKDLFTGNAVSAITQVVVAKTNIDSERLDEHLLDNSVFKKEGFEIILERGRYLPMSDGVKTVFFEKDDVIQLLKKEYESDETLDEQEEPDEETSFVDADVYEQPERVPPIDPTKPMIALTFDDGPSAHTETLLDYLKEYDGRATFFVVGNLIDARQNTLKRIVAEGHEVAGHSWNHRQLTMLDKKEITDQLMLTRAKIYEVTGVDTKIARPPYGAVNDEVKNVGAEVGISFFNWSVDTLDWKTKNADAVYAEVVNGARDGAIILCHDLHKTTVEAMKRAIPWLIEQGYQLVTVSELMEYSSTTVEAGKLYYRQ